MFSGAGAKPSVTRRKQFPAKELYGVRVFYTRTRILSFIEPLTTT